LGDILITQEGGYFWKKRVKVGGTSDSGRFFGGLFSTMVGSPLAQGYYSGVFRRSRVKETTLRTVVYGGKK